MNVSSKHISENKKAEVSLKKDRDLKQSVVPVRFDSIPTRLRFDSLPTRLRDGIRKEPAENCNSDFTNKKKTSLSAKDATVTSMQAGKGEKASKKDEAKDTLKSVAAGDTTADSTADENEPDEIREKCVASPPEEKKRSPGEKKESAKLSEDDSRQASSLDESKAKDFVKSTDANVEERKANHKGISSVSQNAVDLPDTEKKDPNKEDSPQKIDAEENILDQGNMNVEEKESQSKIEPLPSYKEQKFGEIIELPLLDKYDESKNDDMETEEGSEPPQIVKCTDEVHLNIVEKGLKNELVPENADDDDDDDSHKIKQMAEESMEVDAKSSTNPIPDQEDVKSDEGSVKEMEMSFLAISDVRTVTDYGDEQSNHEEGDTVLADNEEKSEFTNEMPVLMATTEKAEAELEEKQVGKVDDTDQKSVLQDDKKVETSDRPSDKDNTDQQSAAEETEEKTSGIDAIASKLVKDKDEPDDEKGNGKGKKQNSADSEAEIKTYATDTMNELLGLYGYDKMDDSVKDRLHLKSSISGQSENSNETETANQAETEATFLSEEEQTARGSSPSASRQVARLCTECKKVKACKYQVLMHGSRRFLCDDNCFRTFRSKQKLTPAVTSTPENRPQTRSVTTPKEYCSLCRKEIKNGQGFLPGSGESKPLCSEECMHKYQSTHAPKRACAQCGNAILGRNKCLTWETMEFCNEDCLGKYQSYLGSHCACCNNAVQRTSLGKYCVRFGSDIKQFCSNNCLEEFKKGLKVCSFCQKDISSGTEGFLAPVGEKGQFKDFCSQHCMEKYETMNNTSKSQPIIHQCSVCNKTAAIKVQVNFEGKSHKLCSEPCIAAFRYANKINTSICDTCHKFFDMDNSQPHTIQFEGLSKRFCAKTCMNVFVLSHRKIVPCTWCKVKKYNFDMIERVDSNNHVQLFCSLNCLSLFRVSLNATSSRSVRCDFCHQSRPAQYHLTMSDASIRNFCSYQCVMNFQSQFTNVTPVTPSSPVNPPPNNSSSQTNSGTPVISSVMSLAPSQQPKPSTTARQPVSTVATSTSTPVVTTVTNTTTTTTVSTASPPITQQQVIIKPPPPKLLKNKALLCKPFLQTKGVSCKPHPCHKSTQCDEEKEQPVAKPVLIPIPVPIFVPMPMHMYVNPTPFPLPFPLPIPVPIFVPTTKNSTDSIMRHIKEIQDKIPENPFEAELLMMAEMVATNNGNKKNKTAENSSVEAENSTNDDDHGGQSSVESQLQDPLHATSAFSDDMLQMALRMATEMDEPAMDLETALAPGSSQPQESDYNSVEDSGDMLSPRELRARTRSQKRMGGSGRGRGRKKARLEEHPSQTPPRPSSTPETTGVLKFTYGVNAWKHWVLQKNTQLEKASQSNRKLKLFKTDLLQLTADELNYSLCLFVKEVRKPNGDEYAPDSIFYLCLGIQQYLFDNGRIDNIFTDAYYEKFTECLNEVLQRYDNINAADTFLMSRIEEEILWEAKQLGAHSPHVLLNTLMYFNTKFFMLKSVDEHMKLSFSHVMKHWKKPPSSTGRGASNATVSSTAGRNVLLRYCPPPSQKTEPGRKRKDEQPIFEQLENIDNPLRCPVKLYEFYLSKCPESIKNRSDVFYLYPERSCVPDSPVWYSTMPLGRDAVSKMLQRIKMVREVCDILITV